MSVCIQQTTQLQWRAHTVTLVTMYIHFMCCMYRLLRTHEGCTDNNPQPEGRSPKGKGCIICMAWEHDVITYLLPACTSSIIATVFASSISPSNYLQITPEMLCTSSCPCHFLIPTMLWRPQGLRQYFFLCSRSAFIWRVASSALHYTPGAANRFFIYVSSFS